MLHIKDEEYSGFIKLIDKLSVKHMSLRIFTVMSVFFYSQGVAWRDMKFIDAGKAQNITS